MDSLSVRESKIAPEYLSDLSDADFELVLLLQCCYDCSLRNERGFADQDVLYNLNDESPFCSLKVLNALLRFCPLLLLAILLYVLVDGQW